MLHQLRSFKIAFSLLRIIEFSLPLANPEEKLEKLTRQIYIKN